MLVNGTGIAQGATVTTINTNTRVITLSGNNTAAVNGNVIFGEETSVNWVNIDIQRTKTINTALAGQGGTPGTRLYLYGYVTNASPPTSRVQGYSIGSRQDGRDFDNTTIDCSTSIDELEKVFKSGFNNNWRTIKPDLKYGEGDSSMKILNIMKNYFNEKN